ncbi:hypothetical protein GX50_07596 [[Emmonsia] crescens]|uniref:Uncharacterized protein n=1 Tax=[Emmonsia] crescens TaxID=73230 RepID=A0A2B7Z7U9_9EURO|nr:hypothetical protein GX50_07596 [Emmonsia crescens]
MLLFLGMLNNMNRGQGQGQGHLLVGDGDGNGLGDGLGATVTAPDVVSNVKVEDYLSHFEGREECAIGSRDIYIPTLADTDTDTDTTSNRNQPNPGICKSRQDLLYSMSNGRRHRIDGPYIPLGCHYTWYSAAEICSIVNRFHSVVFVGDSAATSIYAGFNILLREDLALGAVRHWDIDPQSDMEVYGYGGGDDYDDDDDDDDKGGIITNPYVCKEAAAASIHLMRRHLNPHAQSSSSPATTATGTGTGTTEIKTISTTTDITYTTHTPKSYPP